MTDKELKTLASAVLTQAIDDACAQAPTSVTSLNEAISALLWIADEISAVRDAGSAGFWCCLLGIDYQSFREHALRKIRETAEKRIIRTLADMLLHREISGNEGFIRFLEYEYGKRKHHHKSYTLPNLFTGTMQWQPSTTMAR